MISDKRRSLVFISHATPEDNEFTYWLSTRLKLLGYEVWSDVTQLFGGEKWWDDIEEAVGKFTIKFILVIAKTSLSKPGVKRELDLALNTEESYGLLRFIIPIIIDDSKPETQPYGLSDRNIVFFNTNWADGLKKLSKRLLEDMVPKTEGTATDLGSVLNIQRNNNITLAEEPGRLLSNWLLIENLPPKLSFYSLPVKVSDYKEAIAGFPCPWFEYAGRLSTFADEFTVKGYFEHWENGIYCYSDLYMDEISKLDGKGKLNLTTSEANKRLNFLISSSWDKKMRSLGMKNYDMANGVVAWFFPYEDPYVGNLQHPNIDGEVKRRAIVGYSKANNVYWHYCVSIKPQFGPQPKLTLIPHVVFTEDGYQPLKNSQKMHTLRRRFCKNWWNPRWRDMLLTYLYLVSGKEKTINLPVGSGQFIELCARPMILDSPFSISSFIEDQPDEDDEDVVVEFEEELGEYENGVF